MTGHRTLELSAVAVAALGCLVGASTGTDGVAASTSQAKAEFTSLVSLGRRDVQGDRGSFSDSVSAHGRYVAFTSRATNLVAGDTNNRFDAFVRDRTTQTTERVSVGTEGIEGKGATYNVDMSANGRYVVFESWAPNLVQGDSNHLVDVFLRDRVAKVTRRVSVGLRGSERAHGYWPQISGDGRYVAYLSSADRLVRGDTNRSSDVFVWDRTTKRTRRISGGLQGAEANGRSTYAAISNSGRFVAFASTASNLVRGDTNHKRDVFVWDRRDRVTRQVSIGQGGLQANRGSSVASISGGGRFVAFQSVASNLVSTDTNRKMDVFVRDRVEGVTRRISVGPGGRQVNKNSYDPSVSGSGRFIAFTSRAPHLAAEQTSRGWDVFLWDRVNETTRLLSVGTGGAVSNHESFWPQISSDGRFVSFNSNSTNLVSGDTNRKFDVFLWRRAGRPSLLN